MREIRFVTALAAAENILAAVEAPQTAASLAATTYAVLAAIYEAETRLAGEPLPVLCPSCLTTLHSWLGRFAPASGAEVGPDRPTH